MAKRTLAPVQVEGKNFLVHNKRVLLADDVGVGKTAQALFAINELQAYPALYVTKSSLCEQVRDEAMSWGIWHPLDVLIVGNPALCGDTKSVPRQLPKLLITYYQHLQKHASDFERRWNAVIADEATMIKNRKAERSTELKRIASIAPVRIALTGTPIHNAPEELWSILHFLRPEEFPTYWGFCRAHCDVVRGAYRMEIHGLQDVRLFAQVMRNIMLRRTADVLGLEPVTQEDIMLHLHGQQEEMYMDMLQYSMAEKESGEILTVSNALAKATRLKQMVCHPVLVGGPTKPDISVKYRAVQELLDTLVPFHKVLVFTSFTQFVDMLCTNLPKTMGVVGYHGKLSGAMREKNKQKFLTDKKCRVLVATMESMGEGHNLQVADRVVFVDVPFVPKTQYQCIGRAHRRGQTNQVHVYHLLAKNTIDEHVRELFHHKEMNIADIHAVAELIRRSEENYM